MTKLKTFHHIRHYSEYGRKESDNDPRLNQLMLLATVQDYVLYVVAYQDVRR